MADDEQKKLILFGRNIYEVPCFKQSFTYGILCGLGGGIAHFMFTSRVKRSSDIGVLTFAVVTLCYWFHCRYTFSRNNFYYSQIKNAVQKNILVEGTKDDLRNNSED